MQLKCSSCLQGLGTLDAMVCNGCGELLCPDCATSNGHMCQNCFGSLNYYN